MSTTFTLSRPIPAEQFIEELPAGVTIDPDSKYTCAWTADDHARMSLLLRMDGNCLHAFVEDGMVLSLERYGGNKSEPMVLALCERFGVKMDADFGWTYPDDGTCES